MTHESKLSLAHGATTAGRASAPTLPRWGTAVPPIAAGAPPPGLTLAGLGQGVSMFGARAGFLPNQTLLGALGPGPAVWLRATTDDADPAALLLNLAAAAQRQSDQIGTRTLALMRRQPGPLQGWPALFETLAAELASGLGQVRLVLEAADLLAASSALRLFGSSLLARLPDGWCCVLLSELPLPASALPAGAMICGERELALSDPAAHELLTELAGDVPNALAWRLVRLAEGRALLLMGVAQMLATLGLAPVSLAARRARSADDLLARMARAWLDGLSSDDWHVLALALRLGYSHSQILLPATGKAAPPSGPWLEALADGWTRIQPLWRAPLRAALGSCAQLSGRLLLRAGELLAAQGFATQAVALLLGPHDDAAASVIDTCAERMVELGQWELLSGWLARLPEPIVRSWPRLSFLRGELASAAGELELAHRSFAGATAGFAERGATEGACRSLLASSALALWQGDLAQAQREAHAAHRLSEATDLPLAQSWAAWQAGCLAAGAGELDQALRWFGLARIAASREGMAALLELVQLAEGLAARQRDVQRQRAVHLRAYVAAERDERALALELQLQLVDPTARRGELLASQSWPQLPLLIKLAPPLAERAPAEPSHTSIWRALLRRLGWARSVAAAETPSSHWPQADPAELAGLLELAELAASPAQLAAPAPEAIEPAGAERAVGEPPATPLMQAPQPRRTLTAYLLGPFRVLLNDQPVPSWPSGRGRAIFKYLLSHRERPAPRDVLMELFWPEAEPEAARNNLNVAIHGLRQALRMPDGDALVLFHEGAYQLSGALDLWVDVEEFDQLLANAQRLANRGARSALIGELERATALYQGDFLEDDLYEEWPVLTRERLRVAYLDALGRLSEIRFEQGQHAACVAICQQMLARDSCREDVHRRLMQCYARQDQRYLALRQFQACADALHAELDIAPEPATAELLERIRRRETV